MYLLDTSVLTRLRIDSVRQRIEELDGLFSATEVANGKPAPDVCLHAAEQMGVEPAACVVVEDSPSGVQAASAAGMR